MITYAVLFKDEIIVEIPEDRFINTLEEYTKQQNGDVVKAFNLLHQDLEREIRRR